jgi:biopolymer transport protein ExbD
MKIRRKTRHTAEVSTSSLNDIMFFLLLFFLIISTLVNPNVIKLTLPNSKKSQTLDKQQIVVSVTKDLQYAVNKTPVSFADLEPAILIEMQRTKEATVVLRIDNSLSVQDLVDVLQIGDKLKVKMILATKPSNGHD